MIPAPGYHLGKTQSSKSTSPTFIVEAVRDLVPYDDADATVVERLREVLAVEVRLQDSGGENCKRTFKRTWKNYLQGGTKITFPGSLNMR